MLIILAAVTVTVAITAAVVVDQQRSPTELRKESLLPDLVADINEAASVSMTSHRHKTLLERDNDIWKIANSDDYPALQDKVRGLLIDLSELQTLERKTSNPALYHRLDVQEPSEPDSGSVQVTVYDRGGHMLADVIIGKPRISRATNIQTGQYVRKPDEEHALLVEGSVEVSAEKTAWFEPNIMDIPAARIRSVEIRHPDDSIVHAHRDTPEQDFQLINLPVDRRLASRTLLNRLGSVLQEIRASDVRASDLFEFPASAISTRVRTFDGMRVDINTTALDDRYYAHFEFHYDEQAAADNPEPAQAVGLPEQIPAEGEAPATVTVEQEVAELREQHNDWVYQIPEFKYEILSQTLDNLTRESTTE